VRAVLDDDEFAFGEGVVRALAAGRKRDDGVGVTVDDQCREGDLRQVLAEVGSAESRDAIRCALWRGECGDVAGVAALGLAHLQLVTGGEEVRREIVEECDPVPADASEQAGDRGVIQCALGVVARLVEKRRDSGGQDSLGNAIGAVSADVSDDFPAAHREAHQADFAQVEVVEKGVQVGGESVVVVATPRLRGIAETTAVIGDYPVASVDQGRDLVLPRSSAQGPAVDEHDRFSGAVVVVVDFDGGVVLGAYLQSAHLNLQGSSRGSHRAGTRGRSVMSTRDIPPVGGSEHFECSGSITADASRCPSSCFDLCGHVPRVRQARASRQPARAN
jgi:hypothetical protein